MLLSYPVLRYAMPCYNALWLWYGKVWHGMVFNAMQKQVGNDVVCCIITKQYSPTLWIWTKFVGLLNTLCPTAFSALTRNLYELSGSRSSTTVMHSVCPAHTVFQVFSPIFLHSRQYPNIGLLPSNGGCHWTRALLPATLGTAGGRGSSGTPGKWNKFYKDCIIFMTSRYCILIIQILLSWVHSDLTL